MVTGARLDRISYALPEHIESNSDLAEVFPDWNAAKIGSKTGFESRHVSRPAETATDLAIAAGRRLAAEHGLSLADVDHLLVCTQSRTPDMPVAAKVVHEALGLRPDCGATEFNLGCSGFVYGLGLAKGLIEGGQAQRVLLITTDTYTKYLNPQDRSTRTIFGDGAAATLIRSDGLPTSLTAFVYGTDGSGGKSLIVPNGGRRPGGDLDDGASAPESRGLEPSGWDLFMDGPAIFNFTLDVVPGCAAEVADKGGIRLEDVDLFVLHQANKFMLTHLVKKLGIDPAKAYVFMSETGNTVSSTIPIALSEAIKDGSATPGMTIMVIGFGVGLSWAGALVRL